MKKIFFFLAALMLSFTAHATVVECSPNTNAISWWLTQGDTLVLADGEYIEDYSITFDKPGVCVKAAEGAKPVIKLTGEWTDFSITATTTFDGITFDGGGVAKYFLATTGAESGTLTVVNCVFRNWAYWAISNQFETAASVDAVIVDNCLFHDGQGAAIRFSDKAPEGKHACNYLKVTNSTFYNIAEANYAAVIPLNNDIVVTVNRVALISALRRVLLFSNVASGCVKLKLEANNMLISSHELDFSKSADESLLCDFNQSPMSIGFRGSFLLEILNNMESEEVVFKLAGPNRAGLILPVEQKETETVLMMIMPMMIND